MLPVTDSHTPLQCVMHGAHALFLLMHLLRNMHAYHAPNLHDIWQADMFRAKMDRMQGAEGCAGIAHLSIAYQGTSLLSAIISHQSQVWLSALASY